uniref:Uncharacterized protein n=1 Tax=Cryptosporidium parvum TaxID=5807 RepID=F0X683_CRYPV
MHAGEVVYHYLKFQSLVCYYFHVCCTQFFLYESHLDKEMQQKSQEN